MTLETAEKAFIILIVLFIGTAMLYGIRSAGVESQCLEAGYPEYKVDWKLNGYCYRFDGAVDNNAVKLSNLENKE